MLEDKRSAYAELLALTQLYIFREHSLQSPLITSPSTYTSFKPLLPIEKPLSPSPTTPSPLKKIAPPVVVAAAPPTNQSVAPPPPLPAEKQEKREEPPKKAPAPYAFTLEPMTAAPSLECQEFKPLLQNLFPHLNLLETIPSDQRAQKIKNCWQQKIPPVVLLAFDDRDDSLAFLKNVAKAISRHFVPARVLSAFKIEKENGWENLMPHLRLIIAGDYGLYTLPNLMKHYQTNPRLAKHSIGTIPLLLLSDPSIYIKEPQLKPLLWRAICSELTSL